MNELLFRQVDWTRQLAFMREDTAMLTMMLPGNTMQIADLIR